MSARHDTDHVATYQPERWQAPLDHVLCAGNNSAVAFGIRTDDACDRAYIFQDRVQGGTGHTRAELSPDGKQFAMYGFLDPPRADTYSITVNGEPRYQVPFDVVSRFAWLDSGTLCWSAFASRDAEEGRRGLERIRVFRNGEDVTGVFDFDEHFMTPPADRHGLTAVDYTRKAWWTVDDTGFATPPRPIPAHEGPIPRCNWGLFTDIPPLCNANPQQPQVTVAGRMHRVTFRGVTGPVFHAIEREDGMPDFAISDDGMFAGYIGTRYGSIIDSMSATAYRILEWVERKEPREDGWRSRYIAMPLAMLFTPNGGIGSAFALRSRRYFPATQHAAWRKGYRYAEYPFFTPRGALVVTAHDINGSCVVIDEDEGPRFDAVHHVRWLHAEQAVSYVGQRGNNFLRVVVR
ncbi:hypothetical protein HYV74_04450 [Candidatus Uhrbacteria bacterium]|nr:hypothetical protein [Candidatus Uhrbacteria bacterium]